MSAPRDLVVIGAGGLGREIADSICHQDLVDRYRLVGFLDDDHRSAAMVPYLGEVGLENMPEGAAAIIGVGDPEIRFRVAALFSESVEFESVVHPAASVSPSATIGRGTYIAPFCYVGVGASVGDHVLLNIHSSAGHDSRIDRCCVLSPYSTLNGYAHLGIGGFLGTAAVIGVDVEVGSWSRIAAGSVVTRMCEPGSLVIGNPARSRVLFRPPEGA